MNRPKKQRVHTLDSSDLDEESVTLPIETVGSTKVPCSVQGVTSALGGGFLGYVFGVGRTLIVTRKMAGLHSAGMESGTTFAVFGGVYAAAACFASRIRQKDDVWNGGLAGCATGLVVGWQGGPVSALQSCIGIGVLSAVFELIGKEPAEAQPLSIYNQPPTGMKSKIKRRRKINARSKMAPDQTRNDEISPFVCRHCRPGIPLLRWL